jgi:hypothetical protein
MRRRVLIVFALCQAFGAFGAVFWEWIGSAALWVLGFVLLLPGNLVAPFIDNLLWESPLSLRAMSVVSLIMAIAINFAMWCAVAWVMRRYRMRRTRAAG